MNTTRGFVLFCCPFHQLVLRHDTVAEQWVCPEESCTVAVEDPEMDQFFHG